MCRELKLFSVNVLLRLSFHLSANSAQVNDAILPPSISSRITNKRTCFQAKFDYIHQHCLLLECQYHHNISVPFLQNDLSNPSKYASVQAITPSLERYLLQASVFFFRFCEPIIGSGGQIWRIRWMRKQFEIKFMQFWYRCDRFVTALS